jgi:hypothetical protein
METPFVELTLVELLLIFAVAVGIVYFVKYSVKAFFAYGIKGLKVTYKPVAHAFRKGKERMKNRRICHVCKNPLHKCTCQSNKNVPYRDRVTK